MDVTAFFKMDIFFTVTTIIFVLFGIIGCVLGYFLIGIVRDIRHTTMTIRRTVEQLSNDIRSVHTDIKDTVGEVRSNLKSGLATAKAYGKTVAGAAAARAITDLVETIGSAQKKETPRKRAATKKKTAKKTTRANEG